MLDLPKICVEPFKSQDPVVLLEGNGRQEDHFTARRPARVGKLGRSAPGSKWSCVTMSDEVVEIEKHPSTTGTLHYPSIINQKYIFLVLDIFSLSEAR